MVFQNNLLMGAASTQGGGGEVGGKSGTLWAWGGNNYGQLGQGDTTDRSSPVQIGSDDDWARVVVGGREVAGGIKSNGELWLCGLNSQGQLGLGDQTNRSSLVQVGSLTDWHSVYETQNTCMALKLDGTLWAWGGNHQGELGQGDTTRRSSPVQIGSLTDWVHEDFNGDAWDAGYPIMAGMWLDTGSVIKSDGIFWQWGDGSNNQYLDASGNSDYSSPVQFNDETDWFSCAASPYQTGWNLKNASTAKTLWGWGYNEGGAIGNNVTPGWPATGQRSASQIGGDEWQMATQGDDNGYAVKANGTAWGCGGNSSGELAQGNTTGTSSPVQIGDKTNWKSIWGGTGKWAAVNTSGELWMCGANNVGQLGVGDTTNRSSPVQVGSETDWAQVVGGKYDHTLAIRIVE